MNKQFLLGYVTGVVTAPVVFFALRKPITKHILVPVLGDEDFNEALYRFVSARNDYIDRKKKEQDHGKP